MSNATHIKVRMTLLLPTAVVLRVRVPPGEDGAPEPLDAEILSVDRVSTAASVTDVRDAIGGELEAFVDAVTRALKGGDRDA
jgi:hypothetical protein